MSRVLLVVPPFHSLTAPALSVSLLKAQIAEQGIDADVLYLNLRLLDVAERDLYALVVQHARALVGDWLFAEDLFGAPSPEASTYVRDELTERLGLAQETVARLTTLRQRIPGFLDRVAAEVARGDYDVVVTAMDFAVGQDRIQNCPTLAFLRRIKAVSPAMQTVMGGVNCQGVMGAAIFDLFPFIDYVCLGEVERTVPKLCRDLLAGEPSPDRPGLLARGHARLLAAPEAAPLVFNLDALPYPDFDDYFEQFRRARLDTGTRPFLVMETSRGCWWGEKHHCTFCGLNGDGMAYRAKSPDRSLVELDYLVQRHGVRAVFANDMILNPRYFDTFLSALAERSWPPALFFETKANLTFDQLGTLARAGVREIQPGIESFSTPLLKQMDKGVTALQNVRLLKWCQEVGIEPFWNILYGFPGEPPGEYEQMADLVLSLTHLQPPRALLQIRMDRFSPNFDQWEARGFANVRPVAAYGYVYPFPPEDLERLAYYFEFDHADGRDPEAYIGRLRAAVASWIDAPSPARLLLHHRSADDVQIEDTRPAAARPSWRLTGAQRHAYLALDAGATPANVQARLVQILGSVAPSLDTVTAWCDEWCSARLAFRDGGRYLSLATDLSRRIPRPAEKVMARLEGAVRREGAATP